VLKLFLIVVLIFASWAFPYDRPVTDPLDNVLERISNIFLVKVKLLDEEGYAQADVETVIKGHYENEIWIVRRMHNNDMYPFTPGRRYIIFAKRVMGDTYLPEYDDTLYAVRLVDLDGRIDLTPFEGEPDGETIEVEEFASYCKHYLDPFVYELDANGSPGSKGEN
jgi:hypothetical protein